MQTVSTDTLPENLKVAVVKSHEFDKAPFEGRFRVSADFDFVDVTENNLTGWSKVDTAQPLGELATHLLHPKAPDSFFAWGEFNTIFQRTEYMENYALAPYARHMLKDKPALALEFDKKIREDAAFAKDPQARLNWLYKHTPFYDQAYLKYPVLMTFATNAKTKN